MFVLNLGFVGCNSRPRIVTYKQTMRKLLKPKEVLLLGLAGLLDVYQEVKDPFGVAAEGAKNIYGFVPRRYRRQNFSRVVEGGLRTGEIEKILKNGEVYLRLTSIGRKKIIREFPMLSFQKKKWDGKWRGGIFDISEVNKNIRDIFRIKLKELGFGMLQESVWVTPHDYVSDLREFLETKGLSTMVFVLEVSDILAGDKDYLVNKIWGVNAIHKRYWDLLVRIENWKRLWVANRGREQQPTDYEVETGGNVDRKLQELADEARDIRLEYLQVILADPMLPRELLPKGWLSDMVKREIRKVLMEPLPKS